MNALLLAFLLWQQAAFDLPAALEKIRNWDHGQNREPLTTISEHVRASIADPARTAAIEKQFAAFLGSTATLAAKDVVIRELSLIGTDVSVPVLARMMDDPATFNMALYGLERIPGAKVNEVLRAALPKRAGKERIGIINSLGARRDAQAAALLRPFLKDKDPATVIAAAAALGQIGDARAFDMRSFKPGDPGYFAICEGALKAAPNDRKLHQQLAASSQPMMVRIAALRGLAAISPGEALTLLKEVLGRDEPKINQVAIRLLGGIRLPAATALLVEQLGKASPATQAQVIAALADGGHWTALPAILTALKSDSSAVRVAALDALALLGDGSQVLLLAETAANAPEAEQAAARASLNQMRGNEIDKAIVSNIPTTTSKVKIELIRAAGERASQDSASVLLRAARDQDAVVRREATRALRDTATDSDIPALIDLVVAEQDRREPERTLVAVLRRHEKADIKPLLRAYDSASAGEVRASILQVLGQVGRSDGLPLLKSTLESPQAELKRAAILALTDWPDASPAGDLLKLAQSESSAALQVLALRGFIQLATAPSQKSPQEVAAMLGQAMAAAKRPDEKKSVLAALPRFACKESLALAEAALADPAVAAEAKMAVERLRRSVAPAK